MSSSYNRSTELRNVHTKDLYKLAVILDDENYWQTLMEIIPRDINNQTFGTKEDLEKISSGGAYKRKYTNDHIRLIENAIRRPEESRLYSEIFFDEWSSSGRKHERPTLGVLMHLLVLSKLFRAADFVAELLNEPKPSRPTNGPAADFDFEVDVFKDIKETVNDSRFYPNTEDLQENVDIDINKDYYTKYHNIVDKKIQTINDNLETPITTTPPKPPPRLLKTARLLKQKQQIIIEQHQSNQLLQETTSKNNINSKNVEEHSRQEQQQTNTQTKDENVSLLSSASAVNMPKLSVLMRSTNSGFTATTLNNSTVSEIILPRLSALNNSEKISEIHDDEDGILNSTPSLIFTKSNIVEDYEEKHPELHSIPIVVLSKSLNTNCKTEEEFKSNNSAAMQELPVLSALNLNGEKDKVEPHLQHQCFSFESEPFAALNFITQRRAPLGKSQENNDDSNIPCSLESLSYNPSSSIHQPDANEVDYNRVEHEHDNDVEAELDDDEDSIPNLSFLENRSSNNESSLTSVTNTSGENSFDQSVNDCSSTSTDNVPFLSILNQ